MNITSLFDSLSTRLGLLKEKLKIENTVGDYGLNVALENTFIKILNITYDLNLKNSNEVHSNFPAIDAIDDSSGTIFQITSTYSKEKILSTIKKAIKNDLYKTHKNLKFLFLKDLHRLNSNTKIEIKNICNGYFEIDFDKDIIDSSKIHQKLFFEEDIEKTLRVINILDVLLGTLPINKTSSFTSVAISFSNDEIDNTYLLVDSILKRGINVYLNSKELYEKFQQNEHRFFEYLVFVKDVKKIDHIKNYVVVLSYHYVKDNLKGEIECGFLQNLIKNDYKSKIVSFNPFIKNINEVNVKRFKSYISISNDKEKLYRFSNILFEDFFNESNIDIDFNIDDIKEELKKLYSNFNIEELEDSLHFKAILFSMGNMDMKMVYVILKNKYSQSLASNYINGLKKIYNDNISVLIPKNINHKTRKVLDSFRAKINIENIHFIDEFLFDKSLKKIEQNRILNIDDFINPVIKQEEDIKHLPDILSWIIEDRYPSIGIIKAPGGIGKTTLTEKIHDVLINEEEFKFLVLFIVPSDFIENFKDIDFTDESEYDLYNIFRKCHPQGVEIDETTFYNNYSHGNILMIIDGIDEIISTVSNFSFDTFLIRLSQFNKRIGKGKILITCRDIYIDDLNSSIVNDYGLSNSIQFYELLPFNEKLSRLYFSKHLESSNKIKKCIALLNEFVVDTNTEYKYPPFVLEIVLDFIVNNDFDEGFLDTIFNSKYLLEEYSSDFVIHQIFKREIIKKNHHGYDLSIDKQVAFFSLMAINKNGVIEENEIDELLNKIDHITSLGETRKGLIDHPFLRKKDDYFYFNFKFLKGDFSIIALHNLMKNVDFINLNEALIDTLAYKFNYNSILSKGVLEKIKLDKYFDDKNIFPIVKDLISKIEAFSIIGITKKKSISNLFLLLCEYCREKNIKITDNYLDVVGLIFSKNNDEFISNFYLIDVPEDMNLKIVFSNLYFQDSEVANFSNFIACKFDSSTAFVDSCVINDINLPTNFNIENITIIKENFHNTQGDNSIHKLLRIKEDGKATIENELIKFLKCFYTGRNLNLEIPKQKIRASFNNTNTEKIIIEALHDVGVLTDISNNHFSLNKNLISKINKFTSQGRPFLEINRAFKIILPKY